MEIEQARADVLRVLYRLGVIDFETLDELIDQLQIELFRRTFRSKDE